MLTTQIKKKIFNIGAPRVAKSLGLDPIEKTDPADLFIVGYPKSGTTWFQNLAAGVYYGLDPALAPDALIQRLVPHVESFKFYKRFQTPMLFKTHHLPQKSFRRVVYIMRDGRDVMVSYYHHRQAISGEDAVDFLQMVKEGQGLFYGKWGDHVQQWQANPYQVPMITIRYEDLLDDPVKELQRFCQALDIERDQALLHSVVQGASFAKMQAKEKKFGVDYPIWPEDRPFVRRGEIGSYRDEMPPEVLEAFLADAAPVLAAQGYPI